MSKSKNKAACRTRRCKPESPGSGATHAHRGMVVSNQIGRLICDQALPTISTGYSRCAITLGLDAAERVVQLIRDGIRYRRLVAESEAK